MAEGRGGLLWRLLEGSASALGTAGSGWYSQLIRLAETVLPGGPAAPSSSSSAGTAPAAADEAAVAQLQALLLGSRTSTLKLVQTYPSVLAMDRQDLLRRIVDMKVRGRGHWKHGGRPEGGGGRRTWAVPMRCLSLRPHRCRIFSQAATWRA